MAGIGIRSSINPGVDQFGNPISMWDGIKNGLLTGVAKVGMEWAGESLNLSPLLTALGARGVGGIIEGLLAPDHNPLRGLFSALVSSSYNTLTSGGDIANNPWARSAYLAQLLDFSNIIQQNGLVPALEEYAAGIFSQDAIQSMLRSSDSISDYIQNAMDNATQTTTTDGQNALGISVTSDDSEYLMVSEDGSKLLGRKMNGLYEEGDYALNPNGSFMLKDGFKTVDTSDGYFSFIQVKDTFATDIETYGDDMAYHFYGTDTTPLKIIQTETGPKMLDGVAEDMMSGIKLYYKDGKVTSDTIPVSAARNTSDGFGTFFTYLYDSPDTQAYVDHFYNADGTINKESLRFTNLSQGTALDQQYTQYTIDTVRKIIEDSFSQPPNPNDFWGGAGGVGMPSGWYILANSQAVEDSVRKALEKSIGGGILPGGALGSGGYIVNPEGAVTLGFAAGGTGTGVNTLIGGSNYNKDENNPNDPPPTGSNEKKGFLDWLKSICNPTRPKYIYDARVAQYRSTETGRFVAASDLPWPSDNGFEYSARGILQTGKIIDRYGSNSGFTCGEPGTTVSERGLPPGSDGKAYHQYEVLKPLQADIGPAKGVSDFNAKGGATQYYFDSHSIQQLIDSGFIKEI